MKISNYNVYNLDNAIKASKYPMAIDPKSKDEQITGTVRKLGGMDRGSGHDNFLHGVLVSFDLTCSNKMWVEFQRYHFADIVSSQSTMHKITHLLEDENVFNERKPQPDKLKKRFLYSLAFLLPIWESFISFSISSVSAISATTSGYSASTLHTGRTNRST